jgi:hypothetical protein
MCQAPDNAGLPTIWARLAKVGIKHARRVLAAAASEPPATLLYSLPTVERPVISPELARAAVALQFGKGPDDLEGCLSVYGVSYPGQASVPAANKRSSLYDQQANGTTSPTWSDLLDGKKSRPLRSSQRPIRHQRLGHFQPWPQRDGSNPTNRRGAHSNNLPWRPSTNNSQPRPPQTTAQLYRRVHGRFLGASQLSGTALDQARSTLFESIDTVLRPLLPTNNPHRKDPISIKKFLKGDAAWATRKSILGWSIDTVACTVELPPHRLARLWELLASIPTSQRCTLR